MSNPMKANSEKQTLSFSDSDNAHVLKAFLTYIKEQEVTCKFFIINGIGLEGKLAAFGSDGVFFTRDRVSKVFTRMSALSAISPQRTQVTLSPELIDSINNEIKEEAPNRNNSLGQTFVRALMDSNVVLNGYLLNSRRESLKVVAFDDYVLLVENEHGCHQICFWQSFSTIMPGQSYEDFDSAISYAAQ